jgi:hypothetical protein
MIAFDCPHCHKPLIVPNNRAGTPLPCPGCKEVLSVPQPRPPAPWRRFTKPLLWLLVLAGAAGAVGWKVYHDRAPERHRTRLAAVMQAQSPAWQGFAWEKYDPPAGDYRLSVFYVGSRKRYAFAVSCFAPANQTFVRVDPSIDETTALASLTFTAGATESFRYTGGSDEEREELERLTEELARALNQAVR